MIMRGRSFNEMKGVIRKIRKIEINFDDPVDLT